MDGSHLQNIPRLHRLHESTLKLFTYRFATLTPISCVCSGDGHTTISSSLHMQQYFWGLINAVTDPRFFQGWPVSAGVNFHCVQPFSTEAGRNWPLALQRAGVEARAFTNGPSFKIVCIHEDHWHIASYCCFIQSAPTLDSTHTFKMKFAKHFAGKKRLKVCFSTKNC